MKPITLKVAAMLFVTAALFITLVGIVAPSITCDSKPYEYGIALMLAITLLPCIYITTDWMCDVFKDFITKQKEDNTK